MSCKKHFRNNIIIVEIKSSVPFDGFIAQRVRAKRSSGRLGQKWIEAMILADSTTVSYYGNETMDYVLSIANLVSMGRMLLPRYCKDFTLFLVPKK